MSGRDKSICRELRKLVARYPGFSIVEHGGNGRAIAAAHGPKIPLRGANRLPENELKNLERWMQNHAAAARAAARTAARYADDGERQNTRGRGMPSARRESSLRALARMQELWPRLLPEEQRTFIAEALATRDDPNFQRAREVIGV